MLIGDYVDSTGREAQGVEKAKGRDPQINGHHLADLAQRMLAHPEFTREARVAMALLLHDFLSGTRGIARWSGIDKKSVQEMAGPEGGLSRFGLLYTSTRGSSGLTGEERADMVLRYSASRTARGGFGSSTSRSGSSGAPDRPAANTGTEAPSTRCLISDRGTPGSSGPSRSTSGSGESTSNGGFRTGIAESLATTLRDETKERIVRQHQRLLDLKNPETHLAKILDPSLDLWTDETMDTFFGVGVHGWRLAVLLGLEDVELTLAELGALLGLGPQGVRLLLARWEDTTFWTMKRKVGRTKLVTVRLGQLASASGQYTWDLLRHTVRNEKAGKDARERKVSARRGTPEGWTAWRLSVKNRKREQHLPELAGLHEGEEWAALVEEGDEEALYAFLKARQDPEGSAAPAEPVQEAREPAALRGDDRELLRAMAMRVRRQNWREGAAARELVAASTAPQEAIQAAECVRLDEEAAAPGPARQEAVHGAVAHVEAERLNRLRAWIRPQQETTRELVVV